MINGISYVLNRCRIPVGLFTATIYGYSSLFAIIHQLFLTIRDYSRLFVTIRDYSSLFATIRHYSPLFVIDQHYSRLFALFVLFATIRYSLFGFSRHPSILERGRLTQKYLKMNKLHWAANKMLLVYAGSMNVNDLSANK